MQNYLDKNEEIQVLVFKINNINYGIPVELSIKEVAIFTEENFKETVQKDYSVIGTIILRDNMIGVIDLKSRLGICPSESNQKSVVILKKYNSNKEEFVGLLIEDTLDIKTVNVKSIVKKDNSVDEVFGMIKVNFENKDDLLVLLDGNKFFKYNEEGAS